MKRKTIEKILNHKFNSWVSSIPSNYKRLRNLIQENTIITGGAIVSMLLNEEVSDYDIYFSNKETTFEVAKYYINKFKRENPKYNVNNKKAVNNICVVDNFGRISIVIKSSGIASSTSKPNDYRFFETLLDPGSPEQESFVDTALSIKNTQSKDNKKYSPIFITSNAITLSNKIQIITRFYGSAEEIHKNYDFVHCTNYWTSKSRELILRPEALETILAKELKYLDSLYPLCSLFRIRKFISRGWTINAGQILKIALQLNKLDLNNVDVLEDQLIGVDVAYMMDLINRLRSEKKAKIDDIYICKLIDEIF